MAGGFVSGGTPSGPVGSGIDCFIMQENSILGYTTSMDIDEDYDIEGVQTLGYFGYRDILSKGYSCDFNMDTFLLIGADVAGSLSLPGWMANGNNNINSNGLYTFTVLNVHTLSVLATIMGAQYGGGKLTIARGELMKRGTKWKAKSMIPGLNIS